MAQNTLRVETRELTPTISEQEITVTSHKSVLINAQADLIRKVSPNSTEDGLEYLYQFSMPARGINTGVPITVRYRELFIAFNEPLGNIGQFFTALDTTGFSKLQVIPISTNSTGILYHVFYMYTGTGVAFDFNLFFQNNTVLTNVPKDSDPQEFDLQEILGAGNPVIGSDVTSVVNDLDRFVTIFTAGQSAVPPAAKEESSEETKSKESSSGEEGSTEESKEEGSSSGETGTSGETDSSSSSSSET